MNDSFGKSGNHADDQEDAATIVDRYLGNLGPRRNDGKLAPIPTGFPKLDKCLGGLFPGELTVLAARPGVGKTSLALEIALSAARAGSDVAFFSLEWSAKRVGLTLLSQSSLIPFESLRQCVSGAGETAVDAAGLDIAIAELEGLGMRIYDTPGVSLPEIEATMNVHAGHPGGTLCIATTFN